MSHPDQCDHCECTEDVIHFMYLKLCAECRAELAALEYKREPEINPDR